MKPFLLLMSIGITCSLNAQVIFRPSATSTAPPNLVALASSVKQRPSSPSELSVRLKPTKTIHHWRKLKTAGIILTSVGVACIGVGGALIGEGVGERNHYNSFYTEDDGKIVAGVFGIAGGVMALGGGITMWAIGGNRLRKYTDRMSFDMGSRSATLAYRF